MTPDPVSLTLAPSPLPAMRPSPSARRIKVLQLGPGLDVRGGITTVEQHICDYLAPYVSLRHVATMEEGSAFARLTVFARAAQALQRTLNDLDPAIVHIHFASRGSTLRKLILASMVTRAGRPLVLHAHGGYFDQFHRRLPAVLRRTVNSILQRANVLIALSPRWRDFYINECELSQGQVAVLPNPVRWSPDTPDRSAHREVQFLFLGRMCRKKGTYDLVNAFAALPDSVRSRARLVLAGDGDLAEIRALAAPFGERVRVLSWIDSAERDRLLAQSDVFVLPSYNEGVPMSLLEAMASGLPAIVTPVGGIPDVFSHGVEGLIVEPAHVADLSAAMARLVNDDDERRAAGRRAHERARSFDVHNYARRLADIYQRIAPVAELREFA
ncbi:MAG TPA: glycosyltransferase family 4 protein [Steroidobacteraceae bacterium]|nr:glycosyltransferase family 4 protein [Steroidobacteraceae bacterium]